MSRRIHRVAMSIPLLTKSSLLLVMQCSIWGNGIPKNETGNEEEKEEKREREKASMKKPMKRRPCKSLPPRAMYSVKVGELLMNRRRCGDAF